MTNLFIHEKMLEERCREMQHKMRHASVNAEGAHVDRRYHWARARHVVAVPGKGLIAPGSRLEHVKQAEGQVAYSR
ncbi:MAG TPA: hypothetical protein VKV40_21750 [Ktedonobacteraceae bacterium]|nr:hypothetical protein [Ktedonobacteraceae bacterium]